MWIKELGLGQTPPLIWDKIQIFSKKSNLRAPLNGFQKICEKGGNDTCQFVWSPKSQVRKLIPQSWKSSLFQKYVPKLFVSERKKKHNEPICWVPDRPGLVTSEPMNTEKGAARWPSSSSIVRIPSNHLSLSRLNTQHTTPYNAHPSQYHPTVSSTEQPHRQQGSVWRFANKGPGRLLAGRYEKYIWYI